MHGVRFLDSKVHTKRFWVTGFAGIASAQAHREEEARNVRMLTSFLGETMQKLCDIMGGNMLGAFQRQHGDIHFAFISDYRKTYPWPQVASYPTMGMIYTGIGVGFIHRDVYGADGEPQESTANFDQQPVSGELAGRYADDATVPTVSVPATQQLPLTATASQTHLRALRQAAADNCAGRRYSSVCL